MQNPNLSPELLALLDLSPYRPAPAQGRVFGPPPQSPHVRAPDFHVSGGSWIDSLVQAAMAGEHAVAGSILPHTERLAEQGRGEPLPPDELTPFRSMMAERSPGPDPYQSPEGRGPEYGDVFRSLGMPGWLASTLGLGAAVIEPGPGEARALARGVGQGVGAALDGAALVGSALQQAFARRMSKEALDDAGMPRVFSRGNANLVDTPQGQAAIFTSAANAPATDPAFLALRNPLVGGENGTVEPATLNEFLQRVVDVSGEFPDMREEISGLVGRLLDRPDSGGTMAAYKAVKVDDIRGEVEALARAIDPDGAREPNFLWDVLGYDGAVMKVAGDDVQMSFFPNRDVIAMSDDVTAARRLSEFAPDDPGAVAAASVVLARDAGERANAAADDAEGVLRTLDRRAAFNPERAAGREALMVRTRIANIREGVADGSLSGQKLDAEVEGLRDDLRMLAAQSREVDPAVAARVGLLNEQLLIAEPNYMRLVQRAQQLADAGLPVSVALSARAWNNISGSIDEAIAMARNPDIGGFTFNPRTNAFESVGTPRDWSTATAPYPQWERTVDISDDNLASSLASYLEEHSAVLSMDNHFFGGWVKDDTLYVDIAVLLPFERSVDIGRARGQQGVFRLTDGHFEPTPPLPGQQVFDPPKHLRTRETMTPELDEEAWEYLRSLLAEPGWQGR